MIAIGCGRAAGNDVDAGSRSVDSIHAIRSEGGVLRAHNQEQNFDVSFHPAGAVIARDGLEVHVELRRFGRRESLRDIAPVQPRASGDRAEYARAGLVEWFVNGPHGIEQGFTIAAREPGAGPLVASLSVGLPVGISKDGATASIGTPSKHLFVDALAVRDASGRTIPARFVGGPGRLDIEIDDASASYPLVVDPTYTSGTETILDPDPRAVNARYGAAVARTSTTVVVGAPDDDGVVADTGAVYVFSGGASSWQLSARLSAAGLAKGDGFGSAVAISVDTIVVGAPNAGGGSGEVDVYVRSGTTWVLQQKIAGTGGDQLGRSVAIDGNTLIAGTYGSGADVYVRSGATWSLQATLDASGVPGIVGSPVGISGSIAVVGGPSKASAGEAYVFVRSGTTWTREATLLGDASVPGEGFATSLAISGSTVLVGAPSATYGTGTSTRTGAGAIYAFVRSGTSWSKQATISGADVYGFGAAVALDGDQGIATGGSQGYLFHRSGTTWTRDGGDCCSMESVAIAGTEGLFGEPSTARYVSTLLGGSTYSPVGQVRITSYYSNIEPTDSSTQYGKIAGTSGYLVTAGSERHITFFRNAAGTWVMDARMPSPSVSSLGVYAATPTRFALTDGGSLWIYVRSSSWTLESTVPVPLGSASLLAMDDSTIALSDGSSISVWTRSGSSWISDGSVPVASSVSSLSVSGSIAVGFANTTTAGKSSAGSGAIYVRGASAWTLQATLVAPDPYFGDNFGASIAIDGTTVAVGAPYADPAGTPNTGAVYVFTRSGTTWTQQAKLQSHAPSSGQTLGSSVALLGDVLVAGGGATEVFQRSGTTWTYARSLPNAGTWSVSSIGGATASNGTLHVVSPIVGLVRAAKCDFDGDCASGFCVDKVCCNTACKDNCSACDVTGSVGTCTAVASGLLHSPGYYGRTCGNYAVCSAGVCATSCTSNSDCYYGFRCDAGKCVESNDIGVACSDSKDCKSGVCADGVCCDSYCGNQCEACDMPGQVGHCSQVNGSPHGSRPPCASSGVCGPRCGASRYTCAPAPDGTSCSDDGCAGGVETHASTCDGAGSCNDVPKSCGAYACGGAACKTSCTTSTDCNVGNACKSGECKPVAGLGIPCTDGSVCPSGFCVDNVCCAESSCAAGESCATASRKGLCAKKNGTSCSADADCGSGHCVDGVCCNASCTQQCEACDRPGSEGTCVPVLGPPHGTRAACAGGGDAICGVSCRGNRAGCEAAKLETPCGSDKCTDGIEAKASTCDGVGNCKTRPRACSPFRCGDKACRTTCTTGDDCIADAECRGGVCVLKASGPVPDRGAVTSSFQSCTGASECASGNCVEGVCCDKPCGGVCESCALPGSPGICTPTPYGLDPKGACAAGACVKTCDGKGACVDAFPGAVCAPNRCTGDATGVSAASCSAKDGACPAPEARVPFDCAPYACSTAFGTCFADCKDSSQCAPGFVCDPESLGCKAGAPADDGGGGCTTSRGTRGSALFAMVLLALGLSRGARRRI
ncbi:MAG: FG-GAP repeat protein [Polyangiales bacterium]